MTQNCPLCAPEGEHVIVANNSFRIIRVDDPEFPGYFRLIWQNHVKEVSDLDPRDRLVMWDALTRLEETIIEAMHPEKVNWAQFGTMVPHLHWHLIPRFPDDAAFPDSYWSPRRRKTDPKVLAEREQAALRCAELIKERFA